MADRIPAERGKNVLQIAQTPPDWRTPEEEQRLRAWCAEVQSFIARCEAEDLEFERTWWRGPAIALVITVVMLAWHVAR